MEDAIFIHSKVSDFGSGVFDGGRGRDRFIGAAADTAGSSP